MQQNPTTKGTPNLAGNSCTKKMNAKESPAQLASPLVKLTMKPKQLVGLIGQRAPSSPTN
jgi:hypothetical protein